MITVRVNGEARDVPDALSLPTLVSELCGEAEPRGVAIAINGRIIRRQEWPQVILCPGDAVEIVRAVQGG